MQRDSITNTIVVATVLCLVCSLLVSTAAIQLRDKQQTNAEVFRKRNVLQVAGLSMEEIEAGGGVQQVFEQRVRDMIVDLRDGTVAGEKLAEAMGMETSAVADAIAKYDPVKAGKDAELTPELGTAFPNKKQDIAGIGKGRENFAHVYRYAASESDAPKWIFPIRGRGLWSMLRGFIALESDLQSVAGITYYEHAETPGLGGEVDNPNWKAKWHGKKVYGPAGEVQLKVAKGAAESGDPYAIDGLSGATITSNGVTNMIEFWMGEDGFRPFVENRKSGDSQNPPAE